MDIKRLHAKLDNIHMKRLKSIEFEIHASNMFNPEFTFDYNCRTLKKGLAPTNTPKIHIKCQNSEDPTWWSYRRIQARCFGTQNLDEK
jgi:hypothetical protein